MRVELVQVLNSFVLLEVTPWSVQVIETLRSYTKGEPWAARAACLVFTQYFWFRHCFLLTPEQGQTVQQLVIDMLGDKKLEVQELAAKTLSGMYVSKFELMKLL